MTIRKLDALRTHNLVSSSTALLGVPKVTKRTRRKLVRTSILFGNIALLITVGLFVFINRSASPTVRRSTVNSAVQTVSTSQNPLDQLSSAEIAAQVAQLARLAETTAVRNQADSENAQLSIVPSDSSIVSKPQIVSTGQRSKKNITTYTVKAGDTISSIALRFGITSDSVRWSNGLMGDSVGAGTTLTLPPANGIAYLVKTGDTIDSITNKYRANKTLVITVNDAESGSLKVGEYIWIPDGQLPAPARPSYRAFNDFSSGFTFSAVYGSNGYTYGYCTWHVANRRAQTGRPIPSNLGNAITWVSRARAAGMTVSTEPVAGAVIYHRNIGGLGHVAYVESKNGDGSLLVSDMNYPSWGRITTRVVPPSEFSNYYFIY